MANYIFDYSSIWGFIPSEIILVNKEWSIKWAKWLEGVGAIITPKLDHYQISFPKGSDWECGICIGTEHNTFTAIYRAADRVNTREIMTTCYKPEFQKDRPAHLTQGGYGYGPDTLLN